MKEFIDKTSTREGTPINRANLMAMQGFTGKTSMNAEDGTIVEQFSTGETLITVKSENGYVQTLIGEKKIVKTITFNGDGTITEVIS